MVGDLGAGGHDGVERIVSCRDGDNVSGLRHGGHGSLWRQTGAPGCLLLWLLYFWGLGLSTFTGAGDSDVRFH